MYLCVYTLMCVCFFHFRFSSYSSVLFSCFCSSVGFLFFRLFLVVFFSSATILVRYIFDWYIFVSFSSSRFLFISYISVSFVSFRFLSIGYLFVLSSISRFHNTFYRFVRLCVSVLFSVVKFSMQTTSHNLIHFHFIFCNFSFHFIHFSFSVACFVFFFINCKGPCYIHHALKGFSCLLSSWLCPFDK